MNRDRLTQALMASGLILVWLFILAIVVSFLERLAGD